MMINMIRLGPAGNPINYKGESSKVCSYIRAMNLDAYEYQATYGVRVSERIAKGIKEDSAKNDILVSIHAPYYINLCSPKDDVRERSIERLIQAARAGEWMGAYRIVFHPGFYSGQNREKALKVCEESISRLLEEMESSDIQDFCFAPETTGRISQLGSLSEIIRICKSFDNFEPTIDFAHIYARRRGAPRTVEDYINILDLLEDNLDIKHLHCHYTRIEYTDKGEKKHHSLDETDYGPPLEPILYALIEKGWNYTIICETPQRDRDALKIKETLMDLSDGKI